VDDSKVIVGISPSLAGLEALRFAIAEARRREVPLLAVRTWMLDAGPRARNVWQWEATLSTEGRILIEETFRLAAGHRPDDVDIVVRSPGGNAAAVLKACATSQSDVIIVGASRYKWLPGGVGRGCIKGAGCPVIVVPRPEMARIAGTSGNRIVRELMS
jgi:nucleotide-binding universal stress UspA family protein